LIGPNGAGLTTFFNLITKMLAPSAGTIRFQGEDITAVAPAAVNPLLPLVLRPGGMGVDEMLGLVPNLRERLAIARMQRSGARLLLLDDRGPGAGDRAADRPHAADLEGARTPCCRWSRTCALPPSWPTGTTSSSTAAASTSC
jgi:hypothetical protein